MKNSTGIKMNSEKWLALLGLSVLLLIGFNNCSFEVIKNSENVSDLDQLVEGQKLYSSNCATCHGAIEISTKRDRTASAISEAIHAQPAMRFLAGLTTYEIGLIELALKTPIEPPEDSDEKAVRLANAVIGNRYFVASNLAEIFVSLEGDRADQEIGAIINDTVLSRPEAFGGGCSRYDSGCVPQPCGLGKGVEECTVALEVKSRAASTPTTNVMAKGYMVRACEESLAVDKAVLTALNKSEVRNETQLDPVPNVVNISAFVDYFFRGQPTSADAINQTVNVATQAALQGMSNADQWRFAMLAICQSNSADLL